MQIANAFRQCLLNDNVDISVRPAIEKYQENTRSVFGSCLL